MTSLGRCGRHAAHGHSHTRLATGGAEVGVSGIGDTIERAVRRLARLHPIPGVRPPIAIDEVTAALLAASFVCRDTSGGPELCGERAHSDAARVLLGRQIPCVGR